MITWPTLEQMVYYYLGIIVGGIFGFIFGYIYRRKHQDAMV